MSNYGGGGGGFPPTSGSYTGGYTPSGTYPPASGGYGSSSLQTPGSGGYPPGQGVPQYAPPNQYYQPPPHGPPSQYSQPPYGQVMPGPPVPPHVGGGYPPQHSYQPYPPQPGVPGYAPPGYSAPSHSQMAPGYQQHGYHATQPSVAPDYSQHPQAPIAREAFVNVDTDRNGYLDLKEFIRAMKIVKPNIEYKDALDFFARGDKDQSGRIGLNEFIAVYIEEILPLATY